MLCITIINLPNTTVNWIRGHKIIEIRRVRNDEGYKNLRQELIDCKYIIYNFSICKPSGYIVKYLYIIERNLLLIYEQYKDMINLR